MAKSRMFPSFSSNSTLPELLSVIHLSFERKECNEAERILIRREENLRNELKDLSRDVESLKEERNILEKLQELTETQKNFAEKELKKRKVECEELSERVNRLIDEHKSLVDGKIQAEEIHRKAMEEVKRAETEGMKTIVELKRKNEELEEEIMHYRDNFQQRISNLEETVAGLLGIAVSDVRKGNHENPNSRRSSNDSGGNHYSPRHNQELFADSCDIDVCEKKPAVSSPIAAADGPNSPFILIDTDDETAADESDVIAKTCDLNLNSSLKEMPSVNRMCSVKTEERDGMKDSSFILLHGRKRSLINGDEDNRSAMSRQKTQDTEEIFHDDKGCSNMYGSVALCTVSSDSSSTDSDEGSAADSDIDNTIAKLREKSWKSATDLLSEFEKNYELCMKAVCVLYRRTISGKKLTSDPSIPTTPGFSHFVATRGKELAEFLIEGDQKHRLRRSVAEVKEKCPEVLERCRELATKYNEKLFEIYRKGEDPFFCYMLIDTFFGNRNMKKLFGFLLGLMNQMEAD